MNSVHQFNRKVRRKLKLWLFGRTGPPLEQLLEAHAERFKIFSAACEFARFEKVEGEILEFGVFTGMSLALLAHAHQNNSGPEDPPRRIIGFDSFAGLAPDTEGHAQWKAKDCAINHGWHPLCPVGAPVTPEVTRELFRTCGLPAPEIVVGLYGQVLPGFVRQSLKKTAIAHVDCDLYEAAADVLENLEPTFQDGTFLLFDDWFHYKAHPRKGEARAFHEFLERHREWEAIPYRSYATFCNSFILRGR